MHLPSIEDLYSIYTSHPDVVTDSRKITEDCIFFALRGENFDGNCFAADAISAGASYAVVDDASVAVSDRYILVHDVLRTLQELAGYHRKKLGLPILAITGTNGKTTTKELTASVMASRYRVKATAGNLNNHIGVPLTLLSMGKKTTFGIVEMGASAVGEIAMLCDIAAPDYGIITNVGRAHLEGFGTEEGVRIAKGELYDYLAANKGIAFYREEDEALSEMAHTRTGLKVIPYSDALARDIQSRLEGSYNKHNIAAAAAIGKFFGVDDGDIVRAIGEYAPDNYRSQKLYTGNNELILDCYNANPSSMRSALESFREAETTLPKAVILGDMLELGHSTDVEHEEIVNLAGKSGFGKILLVGGNFKRAAKDPSYCVFNGIEQLKNHLSSHPLTGYIILVKGSRGIGLDRLRDVL